MEDLENQGSLTKQGRTAKRRTLDLSLTQVAASALAAVVGAVLASQLGVYGTILGAAVVSVGATTGTAVFQHVFRRTSEQFREMTAASTEAPEVERTREFDPFDPGGEHTRMMARISPPDGGEAVAVYRGRSNLKPKSWKVYAVTATIVFALAMGTVSFMELASGKSASHFLEGGGGGRPSGGNSAPVEPSHSASTGASGQGGDRQNPDGANASPDAGASSTPHPTASTSPGSTPGSTPTGSAPTTSPTAHSTSGDAATPQDPQVPQAPQGTSSP